jgi:hypothetical protein
MGGDEVILPHSFALPTVILSYTCTCSIALSLSGLDALLLFCGQSDIFCGQCGIRTRNVSYLLPLAHFMATAHLRLHILSFMPLHRSISDAFGGESICSCW